MDILQDLYVSEINFSIDVFWDEGFSTTLGDPVNGIIVTDMCKTISEAIEFLKYATIKYFPSSTFAIKYRDKS